MFRKQKPFWKVKSFKEMTREEWESLCDHCGICCLRKMEDENTGEIRLIGVSCDFLNPADCLCMIYEDRLRLNPECLELTPDRIKQFAWLPETCAYRRLAEGRGLPQWHPLVCGDPDAVHKAGVSVRDEVVCGKYFHPEDFGGSIF